MFLELFQNMLDYRVKIQQALLWWISTQAVLSEDAFCYTQQLQIYRQSSVKIPTIKIKQHWM